MLLRRLFSASAVRGGVQQQPLHLIRFRGDIWEQLQLEEALFRADQRNWCIVNLPAPANIKKESIVLGISGKPEVLVHEEAAHEDGIPLIKRFTGGGTVFIDPGTLFVTFICNEGALDIKLWPRHIMEWTREFYSTPQVFGPATGFNYRENDYCLGSKKIGGNAQSLIRERWLHHTSFLWDYEPKKLARYLKMPPKRPDYRGSREHGDFLVSIGHLFGNDPVRFEEAVVARCRDYFTEVHCVDQEELQSLLETKHDRRTRLL